MSYTSRDLKLKAKQVMRVRLWQLILSVAVFLVGQYLINYLVGELSGLNAWNREFTRRLYSIAAQVQAATTPEEVEALIGSLTMPDVTHFTPGPFGTILAWLISQMVVPLSAGYTYATLHESRHEPMRVTAIGFGFRITLKTIGMNLLQGVLLFLGYMLFIIPGVIMTFRWSMSVYILVDDPSKGIIQCMRESAQIMRGNKWRYFKLQLSFIGWLILSSLVTTLVGVPVLNLWLMPYIYLAQGAFYNELIGYVVPVNPVPPEPWEGEE